MVRITSVLFMIVVLISPVNAENGIVTALSADDRIAIEQVIRSQLAAFRADDSDDAFGYASSGVREKFGNSEAFMLMVREQYKPVYRPRAVDFGRISMSKLGPAQYLTVLGPSGAAFTAVFIMERQTDGAWKIGGCLLTPRHAIAA